MMAALKTCLTSPRIKPDPERQLRMWSGLLIDDEDFAKGIVEMTPLFAADDTTVTQREWVSSGQKPNVHAATSNFAFSVNQPQFDIRARLGEIKTPTLVIAGRHDVIAPVQFSEELHRGYQMPS